MAETDEKINLRKLLPRLDDKSLDIFLENRIVEKEDLSNLEIEDINSLGLSLGQRNYVKGEATRLKKEITTVTTTENKIQKDDGKDETEGPGHKPNKLASKRDQLRDRRTLADGLPKTMTTVQVFRPKTDWSEERKKTLLGKVETFHPLSDAGVPNVNIILVGQQGTGKSSLFNTIDSAITGSIKQRAEARDESKSVTLEINQHKLRGGSGNALNITISDTIGIGRGGQIDKSVEATLRQGVLPGMEICRQNRMHCGVFVLPVCGMDFPADDVLETLLSFQTAFVSNNIKYIVALTKIDELGDDPSNIREIYHSEDMVNRVQEIAKFFRINKNRIWPVKNYTDEVEDTELCVDILALSILQQMLSDANSTLEVDVDRAALEQNKAHVIQQRQEKESREREAIERARCQAQEIKELKREQEDKDRAAVYREREAKERGQEEGHQEGRDSKSRCIVM